MNDFIDFDADTEEYINRKTLQHNNEYLSNSMQLHYKQGHTVFSYDNVYYVYLPDRPPNWEDIHKQLPTNPKHIDDIDLGDVYIFIYR